MSTTREEVVVKIGVDNTALTRGLESGANQVRHWGEEVSHHIAGIFGAGAVIAGFEKVLGKAQDITRISESTGFGKGFAQDIVNIGMASGVAQAGIEKMLDKFVTNLKPGSDPEIALRDFADRLSKIEDPAERAKMAVEAFGKSGVKMIPILKEGSEGLDKMASGFSKLTDEEIRQIEESKLAIERLENAGIVFAGKSIANAGAVNVAGKKFAQEWKMTEEDKTNKLQEEDSKRLSEQEEYKSKYIKTLELQAEDEAEIRDKALKKEEDRLYKELDIVRKTLRERHKLQTEFEHQIDENSKKLRDKLSPQLKTGGKFAGDIARLSALEKDRDQSAFFGNRERFNADRIEIGALKTQIVNGLLKDNFSKTQTPQQKAIDEILQLIAPISQGGMPVKVMNVD